MSKELVDTQKALVAEKRKGTPMFLSSENHLQIENDQEDGFLKYKSQPKVKYFFILNK